MAIRIALFVVPAVAVAGLVIFLNLTNASAGIAVAALGVLAAAAGATLGYFADRLPELPGVRRSHRPAGLHRGD